jgi:hypothetical protein
MLLAAAASGGALLSLYVSLSFSFSLSLSLSLSFVSAFGWPFWPAAGAKKFFFGRLAVTHCSQN